tara:strand:- start:2894 stop:3727 length:834 start_codon:yes stop_codon:yes gene_type:complete
MAEWREELRELPASSLMQMLRGYEYGRNAATLRGQVGMQSPQLQNEAGQNPLAAYFEAHTEGPGLWKWRHYFDIYHRHFQKFRGRKITVLEIGVFSGGSIGMWQDYFGDGCQFHGIDILASCKTYENENVRIHIGDQGDRSFWKRMRQEIPAIDIIIDDGSHVPEHQIISMEEMLPHVSPGGVYLCEDTYSVGNQFHDFVSGMGHWMDELGRCAPGVSDPHEGSLANAVQRDVQSIHKYPYVTVLEKRDRPLEILSAPRRGTQWQPWHQEDEAQSEG